MKKGNKIVMGIYQNRNAVEEATQRFKNAGFRNSDISVLLPSENSPDDFAHTKSTKAPEGATVGAGTGIVLGGALGWLVGAGALAITGLAPLLVAGPIVAALAGAGAGGTIGSLTGGLLGLGFPEYEAKRFETWVQKGGILFSVHVDDSDWEKRAKKIFEVTEAQDVATTTEVAPQSTTIESRTNLDIDKNRAV